MKRSTQHGCHPGEGWDPGAAAAACEDNALTPPLSCERKACIAPMALIRWIPAFAGMTPVLGLLVLTIAVTACGVKGDLKRPSDIVEKTQKTKAE